MKEEASMKELNMFVSRVPCHIPWWWWWGQLASYRLNVYENEIGTGDKIQTLYRTDTPVKLD